MLGLDDPDNEWDVIYNENSVLHITAKFVHPNRLMIKDGGKNKVLNFDVNKDGK